MAVTGSIQTMALPEILNWIQYAEKSGTLTLRRRGLEKKLHVQDGKLISVTTNDPSEYLGQIILSMGLISEDQLAEAFQKQSSTKRLLGRVLIEDYKIQKEQLDLALVTKIEETLYNLFLWDDGIFRYSEQLFTLADHEKLKERMSINVLLMEGARRADTWRHLQELFPSKYDLLTQKKGLEALKDIPKTGNRFLDDYIVPRVIDNLEEPKTIETMIYEIHASAYMVYEALNILKNVEALDVTKHEGPTPKAVEPVLAGSEQKKNDDASGVDLLFREACASVENGRHEKAIEMLEDILVIDETHEGAKKLLSEARTKFEKSSRQMLPMEAVLELVGDLMAASASISSNQEGFIVSRINGEWDVRSILMISPFGEFETVKILRDLIDRGVVRLKKK